MIKRKDEMEILHQEHACNGMNYIEKQFVFSTDEMSEKAKMFARITLPCGSSIGEHPHQPEAEIYYILKGEITVTDNATALPLFISAIFAARSSPPQQGTSMRTTVMLLISFSRRIAVNFSV